MEVHLGSYEKSVEIRLSEWRRLRFSERLLKKDPRLWFPDPVTEIVDRLGWLDLPATMPTRLNDIKRFAGEIKDEGFERVVLLGMGGSSLAPEVYQKTFGNASGFPELEILDTTHPAAVLEAEERLDLRRTFFLVSSKSGTTLETLSLFRFFWHRLAAISDRPGDRFAAITDPGSSLVRLAGERGFRRVFEAPADVGGRFSALSEFGLVPAALIGADVQALIEEGAEALSRDFSDPPGFDTPGFYLGAVLGELASIRNKLTIFTGPSLRGFPDWLEQLVAESLGKSGKGIVPVVDEKMPNGQHYGDDRLFLGLFQTGQESAGREGEDDWSRFAASGHPFIRVRLPGLENLGSQILHWETAVAAAGSVMGVHPFDQPDVQLAKDLARKAMESVTADGGGILPDGGAAPVSAVDGTLAERLKIWLNRSGPGDYVSIQAYLPPRADVIEDLQTLRGALLGRTGLSTTLGIGPRFLHSTGQLHKGGADTGLFLQIVDEPDPDVPVPETEFSFGRLIRAQAQGDLEALRQRGRRVLSLDLRRTGRGGLLRLIDLIRNL